MFAFLRSNSLLWHSLWPWFSGLYAFLLVFAVIAVFYFLQHSKEFRLKFIFFFIFWVVLFSLFLFGYEQLYSLKFHGLLEEYALVRDPQQFVIFLYYQAAFWSTFLAAPIAILFLFLYFFASLSTNVSGSFVFYLILVFTLQFFVFMLVYRWVFPAWLLSISLKSTENEIYLFEPDIFRIVEAFFVEILDFLLFALFLNFIYFSLLKKAVKIRYFQQNRGLIITGFFVFVFLIFYQNNFCLQQACLFLATFDFFGFMLLLYLRLSLWKSNLL